MAVRFRLGYARTLIVAGAAALAGAAAYAVGRPVLAGAEQPLPGWKVEGRSIVWALRPRDFLSCRTAGSVLRQIQNSDLAAPLTLVSVRGDSAWAASLLRSERLAGKVYVVSEREYRRRFRQTFTPMVFILRRDSIRLSIAVPRAASEPVVQASLERALGRSDMRSIDSPGPPDPPGR
jgi:hypothetical protein